METILLVKEKETKNEPKETSKLTGRVRNERGALDHTETAVDGAGGKKKSAKKQRILLSPFFIFPRLFSFTQAKSGIHQTRFFFVNQIHKTSAGVFYLTLAILLELQNFYHHNYAA